MREAWLHRGVQLGVIGRMEQGKLRDLIGSFSEEAIAPMLLRTRRFDLIESKASRLNAATDAILNIDISVDFRRRPKHILEQLAAVIGGRVMSFAFQYHRKASLLDALRDVFRNRRFDLGIPKEAIEPPFASHAVVINAMEREAGRSVSEWTASIAPWNSVVEALRREFGESWAAVRMASVAAGIRSQSETCREFGELLDHSAPLAPRARYARLRSGQRGWWERQLDNAESSYDTHLVATLLVTWGSPGTIRHLWERIQIVAESLAVIEWTRIMDCLRAASRYADERRNRQAWARIGVGESPKAALILAQRSGTIHLGEILRSHADSRAIGEPGLAGEFERLAVAATRRTKDWQTVLKVLAATYQAGGYAERYASPIFRRSAADNPMPYDVAEAIAGNPKSYPGFVVAAAEEICTATIGSKIRPLAIVAREGQWFET